MSAFQLSDQFYGAIRDSGLVLSHQRELIADGTLHRFHVEGDKPNSKNGWYILFTGTIPMGVFGCWRRGIQQQWRANNHATLTEKDKKTNLHPTLTSATQFPDV